MLNLLYCKFWIANERVLYPLIQHPSMLIYGGPRTQEETGQQKPTEEQKAAEAQEDDRKFYEEEERKTSHKLDLKLLSKKKLEGIDITTFKITREGLDYAAGRLRCDLLLSDEIAQTIRHSKNNI